MSAHAFRALRYVITRRNVPRSGLSAVSGGLDRCVDVS